MDKETAIDALSALAQTHRLEVFRRLMRAGPDGLPAGQLAAELEIAQNTLSTHLKILSHSGLIRARRAGRSIIYSVNFSGMQELMDFLLRDCCQGRPEICDPLLAVSHNANCQAMPGAQEAEDPMSERRNRHV